MERIFDSNYSFAEGRETELLIHKTLERMGLVVKRVSSNQEFFDIVLINPETDAEYVCEIKSSKSKMPYITCTKYQGLLETADILECTPAIVLIFTTKREFAVIHAITNEILFSTVSDPDIIQRIATFTCWNKEK